MHGGRASTCGRKATSVGDAHDAVEQLSAPHLVEQDHFGGAAEAALLALPERLPAGNGAPLQHGRRAVEDEHRPHVQVEQLADATKEAEQWRVPHHLAVAIAHGLHKLDEPDGGVDGEALPRERVHRRATAARRKQRP